MSGAPYRHATVVWDRVSEARPGFHVLVDGDPTRDILATRRIVAVWKRGVPVERPRTPPAGAPEARPRAGRETGAG